MSGIYELEEAIERQRCYMDALAEKGMQDEEFYRASVDLDHLIAQYVELEETLREKEYQD
ncbi:MAG: Spo0E family sporulation regulatory protein-aspartic acid phosphatase [Lachnospiraceae bacterium]|nr:Spo0E family sporulation regulatory protein-aspartic acid phosphatase [Lachnospiraceae bacterium]